MADVAIVYAATHGWHSPIRVGSHHIARSLARHDDVLYMSHPLSLGSLASRADNQLASRTRLWRRGISPVAGESRLLEVTWVMPFAPGGAGVQGSRWVVTHGWKLCLPPPRARLRALGFYRPAQLWIDSLFQSFWLDVLEPERLFVRVADHPAHISRLSVPLQRSFDRVLSRAELIVAPTAAIAAYLRERTSSPVSVVPNGVDVAHIRAPRAVPGEFVGERPNVVFVGALARWIDTRLILATAAQCPEIRFWLIGPRHVALPQPLPANVRALGPVAYADMPAYLQHADAALAPFDIESHGDLVNAVDAIKLYEYAAAGLPIVATRWPQSERMGDLVRAVDQRPEAFADALRAVVAGDADKAAGAVDLSAMDWEARTAFLDELFT